jgi:hypothetical protein
VFWRRKVVSQNTYIERLDLIRTPWFEIKIHFMQGPDPERDPHDHPWPFLSLVLRGSYIEHRHHRWGWSLSGFWDHFYTERHHRWYNWMPYPEQAHRITACAPGTITLVLTGGRRREWGFHTRDGWVPWQEYKDA